MPVGYDADGAVSNLYRVGVCPTVAFAYPGGILREAKIGSEELTEEAARRCRSSGCVARVAPRARTADR